MQVFVRAKICPDPCKRGLRQSLAILINVVIFFYLYFSSLLANYVVINYVNFAQTYIDIG